MLHATGELPLSDPSKLRQDEKSVYIHHSSDMSLYFSESIDVLYTAATFHPFLSHADDVHRWLSKTLKDPRKRETSLKQI